MRILTVCLALLLMAATAEAQGRGGGGFHGGGGGLHAGAPMFRDNTGLRLGFRPGFGGVDNRSVVISPFFGFPFLWTGIDPLYSGPIFTAPTYITTDQTK